MDTDFHQSIFKSCAAHSKQPKMNRSILTLIVLSTFAGTIAAKPDSTGQTGRANPNNCSQFRYVDPTEEQLRNFTFDPRNFKAGPYFEGDIIGGIPHDLYDRNGVKGSQYKWPYNTLVYYFEDDFTAEERGLIMEAQQQIRQATKGCIRFRLRSNNDRFYVRFKKGVGCNSYYGFQRNQKRQIINLQAPGCFATQDNRRSWTTPAHEMIHALGFYHEHTRPDRDQYVRIIWENIIDDQVDNFCLTDSDTYDQPYDYDSIMHYNRLAFSKYPEEDGGDTILPIDDSITIGQESYISRIDAIKLMKMYDCA